MYNGRILWFLFLFFKELKTARDYHNFQSENLTKFKEYKKINADYPDENQEAPQSFL